MVDRHVLRAAESRLDRDGVPVRLEPAGRAGVRVMCEEGPYSGEFTVRVSRRAGAREVVRRVLAGLARASSFRSFSSAPPFGYGAAG